MRGRSSLAAQRSVHHPSSDLACASLRLGHFLPQGGEGEARYQRFSQSRTVVIGGHGEAVLLLAVWEKVPERSEGG